MLGDESSSVLAFISEFIQKRFHPVNANESAWNDIAKSSIKASNKPTNGSDRAGRQAQSVGSPKYWKNENNIYKKAKEEESYMIVE